MNPLSPILYDHIGREYPRLNRYLAERAELEQALAHGEGSRPDLTRRLDELKKNRDSHPYMRALKSFREKEKAFERSLLSLQAKAQPDLAFDDKNRALLKELARADARAKFYKEYADLDYEAKLSSEKAHLMQYHLPRIASFRHRIHREIEQAREKSKGITPEMIREGQQKARAEAAAAQSANEQALASLETNRREGRISKKALANGRRELKKDLESKLAVNEFLDPQKANEELIAARQYELKSQTKVMEDVMHKDIADLRRKTPVETEKRTAWLSLVTLPVPGLAQLLMRQPVKGLLLLLGTLFTYGVALPYALGFGNYMGKGLFGLFSLARGGTRQQRSIIFMIEGIIAIALVAIALGIIIASFLDARKTEKGLIRGVREKNWFETKNTLQTEGFPFAVSLPALLALLFIVIVPLATTVLLSFTNQNPNNQAKFNWIGFDNYVTILQGKGTVGQAFLRVLGWTIVWTLTATSSAIFVGFALALLTNNPRVRGKAMFRTIYLLPWAVPAFITIMFFSLMAAPGGAIATVLSDLSAFFGGTGDIRIKDSATMTRAALILLQTWLGSSYVFLLSTGVLQAIPEDLYEAAQIDGASGWQRIFKITLPLVLFQTAPLLVGQYTFNFNNFSVIRLFNSGGPFDPSKYGNVGGSSDLLISYIYNLVMVRNYQALGAAVTMLVSLALIIFTFIGFRNSKAFREERL